MSEKRAKMIRFVTTTGREIHCWTERVVSVSTEPMEHDGGALVEVEGKAAESPFFVKESVAETVARVEAAANGCGVKDDE